MADASVMVGLGWMSAIDVGTNLDEKTGRG